MDELKYELLAEVYGRMEAELIKSYLEAHDIDVELFQESIGQNIYPTTVDMLGNVQVLIRNIGLAVVFSLSLVTANSMAMAMRERVTEIAVLKAIGFPRSRVLFMVLGEACTIAMLGGFLGVGMGCLFLQGMNRLMPQFFPFTVMEMLGPWISYGLIAAAVLGLISGIVPAIRAAQMSVINGLRRVA